MYLHFSSIICFVSRIGARCDEIILIQQPYLHYMNFDWFATLTLICAYVWMKNIRLTVVRFTSQLIRSSRFLFDSQWSTWRSCANVVTWIHNAVRSISVLRPKSSGVPCAVCCPTKPSGVKRRWPGFECAKEFRHRSTRRSAWWCRVHCECSSWITLVNTVRSDVWPTKSAGSTRTWWPHWKCVAKPSLAFCSPKRPRPPLFALRPRKSCRRVWCRTPTSFVRSATNFKLIFCKHVENFFAFLNFRSSPHLRFFFAATISTMVRRSSIKQKNTFTHHSFFIQFGFSYFFISLLHLISF